MDRSLEPLMILVSGPYRSGTGDDPEKLAEHLSAMEAYALAGSRRVGDAAFEEIFHPIAERLLARCDAVLRVGGASHGADLMVRVARERALAVFSCLREVPGCG
jgi:hypothetical protein